VTNSLRNALAMGLATTFVLIGSNTLVSMLRRFVPGSVRIATFIVIIASFTTVVDYAIQAISLTLYGALGAFIQLIVVNCIILGRAEAYAARRPVLLGVQIFGPGFQPWVIMLLPPGGFFVLGAWLLVLNALRARPRDTATSTVHSHGH
jgi:electron transport complex protein RnfE